MTATLVTETSFKSYTAYGAAKLVNAELQELGHDTIPPQMVYQYVSKGYIKSFTNAAGKRVVNESDLATWFVDYLNKKAARAAKKANAIAAK
jgi:hypothetical protein